MTSENTPSAGPPVAAGTPGPAGGPVDGPARADALVHSASGPRPCLDWDHEPDREIDPEDSRGGRADNLGRLLDEIPPHHVDY